MLHLVAIIFKLSWLLALFKLATTVFNLEFGISRHYLRLLELVFRIGKKKFRVVGDEEDDGDEDEDEDEIDETTDSCSCMPAETERPNSLGNLGVVKRPAAARKRAVVLQAPKIQRRISTPDGPPVFLLDDDDYDYDYDALDQDTREDSDEHGDDSEGRGDGDEDEGGKLEPREPQQTDGDDKTRQQEGLVDEASRRGKGPIQRRRQQQCHATPTPRRHEFQLYDPCKLVVRGISAIIDDDVIKRFTPEQLKTWNLLTRTNAKNYQFMSRSMGLFWLFGLLMRYLILLPLRIMFTLTGLVWLISTMSLIGALPKRWRPQPYRLMSLMSFRMLACGITSRLEFHNSQFRAQLGDICVANHTSPLDVVLLACDNCYALVGQRHGGILGVLEMVLSRATEHVWFDRAEMRDRQLVTRRLKEHIGGKSNLPVLIFPEGTCINNSAVMMFRKGSFETTDRVCPVAIKYDPRFGDPFWNSSKQGYVQYLLMMMSSWAIKCDVWYLPPMSRLDGESSAEFANRVKAEIAKQGGLVDLAWDGQLKRTAPKMVWKFQQQEDFANRLKLV